MAENLKATKYNDGTSIPLITNNYQWRTSTTPGYCWYGNDEESYKDTYGALYNLYAINNKKLCPTGWHISTDEDWTILSEYLGGWEVAGGKLKEEGTIHWRKPNTGATDEEGFSALPGGARTYIDGSYVNIGIKGAWWSPQDSISEEYVYRTLSWDHQYLTKYTTVTTAGLSIRCVKDQ